MNIVDRSGCTGRGPALAVACLTNLGEKRGGRGDAGAGCRADEKKVDRGVGPVAPGIGGSSISISNWCGLRGSAGGGWNGLNTWGTDIEECSLGSSYRACAL
jgi:hypothetical protein